MATKKTAKEIKSPLKAWPGKFVLPLEDDFNGSHWQVWKDSFNKPSRKAYAYIHLYGYAGLELIDAAGEWDFEIPLSDVQAWENNPEDERIKFMAWIGRAVMSYMDSIMDPKG